MLCISQVDFQYLKGFESVQLHLILKMLGFFSNVIYVIFPKIGPSVAKFGPFNVHPLKQIRICTSLWLVWDGKGTFIL